MERISRRRLNPPYAYRLIPAAAATVTLLFICLYFPASVKAQKRFNTWYFGSMAGIDFNSTPPLPLANNAMFQLKGCASISDKNTGSILFYTNGVQVYNRLHQVMPGGTGLNGHNSSSQSAVIVPKPGDPTLYYIFTADAGKYAGQGLKGVCYSVVDMKLDGGNGDVVTKNISLMFPATEQLTAVRHCNGEDYWIIAHSLGSRTFRSWLLGRGTFPSAINYNSIGSIYSSVPEMACGHIKVSPDGMRIASAVKSLATVELFDFNNSSGQITQVITIPMDSTEYALEFSPDSKKLYVANSIFNVPYQSEIYQYDLSAGSIPAIVASRTLIYSATITTGSSTDIFGTIQSAPDGKLYVARNNSDSLGIINNPNQGGAGCNYQHAGFYLGGKKSLLGLPNIMNNELFNPGPGPSVELGNDTFVCAGSSIQLDATTPGALSYSWSSGDSTPVLNVSTSNWYSVVINVGGCIISDSLKVLVRQTVVDLGEDTTSCPEGTQQLDAGLPGASYLWSTGETSRLISAKGLGKFWVIATHNGCSASDTVELTLSKDTFEIIVPNVFTPNADDYNDQFEIITPSFSKFELSIYNRWAQLVFESKSPKFKWDGTLGDGSVEADNGTYFYVLKYRSRCADKDTVKNGSITLIR